MSDVTNIPRQNAFSTTLTSSIDASETSITLDEALAFAIGAEPAYLVIDPKNNFREVVRVTAGTNPYTVTRGVADYDGGPSTAQVHSGGARVVLTNSWNYYDEYATAINSKADSAGDVFTGPISFSGATNSGIRAANLTTAERTALTAANGMMVYDTTLGEMYQYIGGAWQPVEAGSTQPNATTAVAGKVELPSAAEVLAGTAVGGTGAALAVTPDTLMDTGVSKTSSLGAADAGKIVRLDANGLIDNSFMTYDATEAEIDQALDGISVNVTAANLNTLTGGGDASALHSHLAIEKTYTAYEAVTADQALALLPVQVEYFSPLTEADIALGDNNARRKYAVKIYPTRTPNFTTLGFRGKENGTSTALITVTIETDNAGSPSGTAVANGTAADLDSSSWTSTYATRTATFPGVPTMVAGTPYWVVFSTNNTDAANYVVLGVNSTYDEHYITFERKTYDAGGASWGGSVTNATPFFWTISETASLGLAVVPTDADFAGRAWTFEGFAKANAAAQASVQVYTDVVPNLSLSIGERYWLSSTAGGITTTKPTTTYNGNTASYQIGRAISDTELRIERGEKVYKGYLTPTASATTIHQMITWFTLNYMEVQGSYLSTANIIDVTQLGIYDGVDHIVRGTRMGDASAPISGFGGTALPTNRSFGYDTSAYWQGVGSSPTDIGFTYTVTKTSTPQDYVIAYKIVGM